MLKAQATAATQYLPKLVTLLLKRKQKKSIVVLAKILVKAKAVVALATMDARARTVARARVAALQMVARSNASSWG